MDLKVYKIFFSIFFFLILNIFPTVKLSLITFKASHRSKVNSKRQNYLKIVTVSQKSKSFSIFRNYAKFFSSFISS